MADRTLKNIENINIGDSVLTYNFTSKSYEVNPILKKDINYETKLVKIVFSNKEIIYCTEDHSFYVKGKGLCSFNPELTYLNYKYEVNKLQTSDYCQTIKNNRLKRIKITQIELVNKKVKTYNLSNIRNTNNYFVNGILIKN